MRKIAQIFVTFLEKLNFNAKHLPYVLQQASCRQPYEPYSCNRLKTLHVTKKLTGKIKKKLNNSPHHEINQANKSNNCFTNFALVDLLDKGQLGRPRRPAA